MTRRGIALGVACAGLMATVAAGCGSDGKLLGSEPAGVLAQGLTGPCPSGDNTPSIVCNGNFEDGQLASGTYNMAPSIPGWTAVAVPAPQTQFCTPVIEQDNDVGITYPSFWSAFNGNQSVELNSNCPSGIEQDLATVPGTTYTLMYFLAARFGDDPQDAGVSIYWDGNLVVPAMPLAPQWMPLGVHVTATASTTKLAFYSGSTTNTSYGNELDHVMVFPPRTGTPLTYGTLYHLQNGYQNWTGGYLDTRDAGCDGNALCVSTATTSSRDGASGTWKLRSMTGKPDGSTVSYLEGFYFENQYVYNGAVSYLDTRDAGCNGDQLCVSTSTSTDRDSWSGSWMIVGDGSYSGSTVYEGDAIFLVNGYNSNVETWQGGYLDTRNAGCEDNLLCVSTSSTQYRDSGSTLWRIVPN